MSELEGIIYPPPDLRNAVDRTATYVAKNGNLFEAKIIREHSANPRFRFLLTNDPYHAYYKYKIEEIRKSLLEGNHSRPKPDDDQREAPSNKQQIQENTQEDTSDQKTVDQKDQDTTKTQVEPQLNEYIKEKTTELKEPPPLNFITPSATSLSPFEDEVIKLTACFIARYGRAFLLEIVSREQTNDVFDFLKPQHSHFIYMSNLIMQYALINNPPLDILSQLEKEFSDQNYLLENMKRRADWNKMLRMEKMKKEEAVEREKELYNSIDWQDFVLVETVQFQPGDKCEYPPTTPDQVGTRILRRKQLEDQDGPLEMDIESESEDEQPKPDIISTNIRKDYDPKAFNKPAFAAANQFVSPITNERVSVDKIQDHVRFNLADPRHLDKKKHTPQGDLDEKKVFASGVEIQSHLKKLAERRTDIFGTAETAIGQRIGEEEEEQKEDNPVIWDGYKSSLKKKRIN